ncbi:MAG: hypothetical protein GY829_03325 [Gammaproteobacteria bacterium]|nr:hypothetical protein [Gammaproteobacteria bacterium]
MIISRESIKRIASHRFAVCSNLWKHTDLSLQSVLNYSNQCLWELDTLISVCEAREAKDTDSTEVIQHIKELQELVREYIRALIN